MDSEGISVIIITRDEEHNIVPCLETLPWAAEVIVVDSGSADRTVERARKWGARVVVRAWSGYAQQLNYAASLARHDWILRIDADERVTPELAREVIETLPGSKRAGFRLAVREYMFGDWINHGGWDAPNYIRLYRRSAGKWKGHVHETLTVDGPIGVLKYPVLHFSHSTISRFIRKLDKYTQLEAEFRFRAGAKPRLWLIVPIAARTFVGRYVCRRGYRDGAHGFALAVLMSMYYSARELKLWELWHHEPVVEADWAEAVDSLPNHDPPLARPTAIEN